MLRLTQRARSCLGAAVRAAPCLLGRHQHHRGIASESAWGIPVTCAESGAVTVFDAAVADYLGLTGDPVGKCGVAASMDPAFAMAMVLEAFLMVLSGGVDGRTNERVVQLRRRLQFLVEKRHCTFRERSFVAALHAWADGRIRESAAILEAWLLEQPHDVLAVRVLHGERPCFAPYNGPCPSFCVSRAGRCPRPCSVARRSRPQIPTTFSATASSSVTPRAG